MLAKAYSFASYGSHARLVTIEVNVFFKSSGYGTELEDDRSSTTIIGLPDTAIRESKERVRSALFHADLCYPKGQIVISLAPADLKKHGPAYVWQSGQGKRKKPSRTIPKKGSPP